MALAEGTELYRNVIEAMDEIRDLMKELDTGDPKKRELRNQRNRLRRQRDRLLAKALDEASEEYARAETALSQGIAKIKASKKKLENVADVIAKVAKAVDLIIKVAAA